ncbi:MAG TPA: hypothetical protein PK210_05130 [Bacteroidia bacterium]|nr:hypothetical protein [Bacteroidia bacterium]
MKKTFTVFLLQDAVSGISNDGIEYDDSAFVLSKYYTGKKNFDTVEECESHVYKTLTDYKSRGVGKTARFVILPVYHFEDDKLFS